jgi:prepilin peptidase CpaA
MSGSHITIWTAFVAAFALTAAIADLRWRRIPRLLTVPALAAGLLYHAVCGSFLSCLEAAGAGFVVGLVFFQLKAIGGGDVKLIMALGALLGWHGWLVAMEVAVFAAALIALGQAIRTRRLRQVAVNMGATLSWLVHRGLTAHPAVNVANSAALRAPFGVAAAMGTLFALIRVTL